MYTKSYKTLLKEMNRDTNKWKDIPYSKMGKLNIVKMIIPPNVIKRFHIIPIRIPKAYFFQK